MTRANQRGLTLLELLIALCVLGILLSIGPVVFASLFEQRQLRHSVQQLQLAIRQARSEAVLEGQRVKLSFVRYADGRWCFGQRLQTACDCRIDQPAHAGYCQIRQREQRVGSEQFGRVGLQSPLPFGGSGTLTVNPTRGTMSPGRVTLITKHYQTSLVVSAFGRLRWCSDAPAQALPGVAPC